MESWQDIVVRDGALLGEEGSKIVRELARHSNASSPEEWVDTILSLAAAIASAVFLDPLPGGAGKLRFRVDGFVVSGPDIPADLFQGIMQSLYGRAWIDPSALASYTEGLIPAAGDGGDNLRLGLLGSVLGPQATIYNVPHPSVELPWRDWSKSAQEAAERINRHPNGLVVFCHRTCSLSAGEMHRWLAFTAARVGSEARLVRVADVPLSFPAPRDVVDVRVAGGESWAQTLSTLVQQDFDLFALAGRDSRSTVSEALLTALEDRYVLVDVPMQSVTETLSWLLTGAGLDTRLLMQVLLGVVRSYGGLRALCPDCCFPRTLDEGTAEVLRSLGIIAREEGKWMSAGGCSRCRNTGFRGRLPLAEALYVDRELAGELAVFDPTTNPGSLERLLDRHGFPSQRQEAVDLAAAGTTTVEEALRVTVSRRADL